jgi:uncharacterized membrane protein
MARGADGEGEHHQPIIRENLASLMQKRREEDRNRSFTVKLADAITAQIGTMTFVYIHALAVGAWIALNKIWPVPGWVWDPSLVILATAASVEAIFLSTFILISQNKMQERADQRAELSLQISLLAERESTRLLEIVLAMAARLGVSHEASEEASELARSTDVLSILDEINRQQDG